LDANVDCVDWLYAIAIVMTFIGVFAFLAIVTRAV